MKLGYMKLQKISNSRVISVLSIFVLFARLQLNAQTTKENADGNFKLLLDFLKLFD